MLAIVVHYIIWAKLQETGHAGHIAQFAYALSCLFCTCMIFYSRQMHGQWVTLTGNETTLCTNALSLKCISTIRPKFDRMPDDLFIFYSITTLKLE